jgi:hypothetical protein
METKEGQSKSEKKKFLASILIIIGRLCLIASVSLLLFAVAIGYQIQPLRIATGILGAIFVLLIAGNLVESYSWIVPIIVQSFAFGFLVLGVLMVRLYFSRDPHVTASHEQLALAVSLAGFISSVLWLRNKRRVKKA